MSEELARSLEGEGAVAKRCPMLSISDTPDSQFVATWLQQLVSGQFTHVVLLTGEGLRRLIGFADREGIRHRVIAALQQVRLISRGAKPVQALKEFGICTVKVAAEPTTQGVIDVLQQEPLASAVVGIQLYCDTNPPLTDFLKRAGASWHTVLPYVYAPAVDSERLVQLIDEMSEGRIDAVVFTSCPQVERIFEVAHENRRLQSLQRGLQRTKVAALGAATKERLIEKKIRVDLAPEQPIIKNVLQLLRTTFSR